MLQWVGGVLTSSAFCLVLLQSNVLHSKGQTELSGRLNTWVPAQPACWSESPSQRCNRTMLAGGLKAIYWLGWSCAGATALQWGFPAQKGPDVNWCHCASFAPFGPRQ